MYLVLQSTYEHIEIGLFSDNHCLQSQTVSKMDATRLLIPTLNELLIQHSLSLTQIDCIIANKGPAPFTTLRVLLSTLNGIAFSTPIPLIEVNGLEAFMHELKQQHPTNNIAIILNAFSGQCYYLIEANGQQEMGCKKNDELIAQLNGIPNLLAAVECEFNLSSLVFIFLCCSALLLVKRSSQKINVFVGNNCSSSNLCCSTFNVCSLFVPRKVRG